MLLSYQISLKLSGKFCFVHNMGISSSMSADTAVIKVCCPIFRDEVEAELKKYFAAELSQRLIRLQLPASVEGTSVSYAQAEE